MVDHIFYFQNCWMPVGSAFAFGTVPLPPKGQAAQVRPIDPSLPGTIQVAKSIENIAGSIILVEEIKYTDLLPLLSTLPQASLSPKPTRTVELAQRGQFLVPGRASASAARPIQIAAAPYRPKAVTLDYTILNGGASSYIFTNTTYWITNTFTIGTSTFNNNACIKFNTNAYLFLDGPVSFPSSGSPVIFTSVDDNAYGTPLPPSTANPGYAAKPAVWFYYQGTSATMQNALVRWAQQGVEYTVESGGASQNLYSSVFQDCTTGITMNMPNVTLYLSGDTYCNVATPISNNGGTPNGSMTKDCGVVSVAMVNDTNRDSSTGHDPNKNSQSECSFVMPDSSTVVAAFWDTHLSQYALGVDSYYFPSLPSPRSVSWATSVNSGASFNDWGPLQPSPPSPTSGDAGDPVMTYAPGVGGPNGTIYLLVNPSREPGTFGGFRLWASTDKGASFNTVNLNVPPGISGADKPMIKSSGSDLYVAGTQSANLVWVSHSANGGISWDPYHQLDSSYPSSGAEITIAADGTVYVFWLLGTGSNPYSSKIRYAWLSNGTWSSSRDFGIILNSPNTFASGKLLRSVNADLNDFFDSNGFPRAIIANGCVYLVYADVPSSSSGARGDRGDIFLAEAFIFNDHSLAIRSSRTINNDRTPTDQWNPSITVNPAGNELFIGYYSRQNDRNNSKIMAYGAKGNISAGLALATFECFPLNSSAFSPLFAGTAELATNGWSFDPVWPQGYVCLDNYATYVGASGGNEICANQLNTSTGTGFTYVNSCADDYTWAASDSSYFYFAWCDRSRTYGTAPNTRPDADVQFAKIKQ